MRDQQAAGTSGGGELMAAAEAHDALFSFDYRARAAALEVGLPVLPEGLTADGLNFRFKVLK